METKSRRDLQVSALGLHLGGMTSIDLSTELRWFGFGDVFMRGDHLVTAKWQARHKDYSFLVV